MEHFNTKNVAILAICGAFAFAVAMIGIVWYNVIDREATADTASLCIDSGGTWIAETKDCIR